MKIAVDVRDRRVTVEFVNTRPRARSWCLADGSGCSDCSGSSLVNFNPGDSVDLSVCAANGCDGMGVAAAINLGAFGAGTAVGRLLSSAVDAGHITNVASGAMAAQFTTVTWVPNSLGLVGLDLRADAGSIAFTTSMFGAG